MKNIRKLGNRLDDLLVNGACSHLFAINSLTSNFLMMKLTRQRTLIPLSIKKSMRSKCHNCRDMLELGLVLSGRYVFLPLYICTSHPLSNSLDLLRYSLHAYEISCLSSRTLSGFYVLLIEPCLVTLNTYCCILCNLKEL